MKCCALFSNLLRIVLLERSDQSSYIFLNGAPDDGYYSFRMGVFGVQEQSAQVISFMPLSSNPTKGMVTVSFSVPKDMDVSMVVFDVLGRNVRTLLNGEVKSGTYLGLIHKPFD